MIAITLNFKSIEAARAALLEIPTDSLVTETVEKPAKKPATAASGQTTAVASAAPVTTAKESAPAAVSAETPAPASTAATTTQVTADPKPVAEPSAPEAPAAQPASSPERVEYPVLQKAVFTLAGKDKAAAIALLQELGVKTAKELPEARWPEALAKFNAKIGEL